MTGQEVDGCSEGFDAATLVGREGTVEGAMPAPDQAGWTVAVWLDDDMHFLAEDALAATGKVAVLAANGVDWVPRDATNGRPWRDDVLIVLTTDTADPDGAEAVVRRAAQTLRAIDDVDRVDWRVDAAWHESDGSVDAPAEASVWVWSNGDVLEVYARIINSGPDRGWDHDQSESTFITSRWNRTDDEWFLALGIEAADVTYRRWTSPRRRSRSEIKQMWDHRAK